MIRWRATYVTTGLLIAVVTSVLITDWYLKQAYQQNTPVAVQQQHKATAKKLHRVPSGTFIQLENDRLMFVQWPAGTGNQMLHVYHHGHDKLDQFPIDELSKVTKKIVQPNDPTWCETAKEFFIPK